jgi:hypothetical protein
VLEYLPAFLLTTTVQGLPALIALIVWSEGGGKLLRQYGARMLWEMAGLVAIGIGILLYLTLSLVADDGASTAVAVITALCAVPIVTFVTHRIRVNASGWRLTLAAGVSYLALEAGLLLGIVVSVHVFAPKP